MANMDTAVTSSFMESVPMSTDEKKPSALEGAGPDVGAPKPVEVLSVPQTPVNGGATPAGASPRPELNIPSEPAAPKERTPEAPVILGRASEEPAEPIAANGATTSEPTTELPGVAPDLAGKRKLEQDSAATNGAADEPIIEEERPEKKTKVTDKIAEKVAEVKDKIGGKSNGEKGKPGRPKKDKTAAPPVGRAMRKTRSQGPAAEE